MLFHRVLLLLSPMLLSTVSLSDNNYKTNWLMSREYLQNIDENYTTADWILPKVAVPERYRIHIDAKNLYEGSKDFSGEVEMDILVKESTSVLIMHSRNQQINDVTVFNRTDMSVFIVDETSLTPSEDLLTIYVQILEPNTEIMVRVKYSTTMTTYEAGFYQKSYVNNNRTSYVGATQFQATDARFAFPLYDEPALKAVFELKITHDERQHAISNTFGTEMSNGDGTSTTTFDPTPLMSSYLLAFVVSDLEFISNEATKLPNEPLHRVWVRPDSLSRATYALENSISVLKALEDYVEFKYEMPKIDSVGVPDKVGAMENWGMVTYRESAMIYEENSDDISHTAKLSGVNVICHELAHQFFGDSVTCEWWDYTWLNEGFATLFEYQLMGLVYPDWRTRDFFNTRTLQNVFRSDSREATRAMTPNPSLQTTSEILNGFDYVVYAKAGSVLRMFQNAVGEDIFRSSLNLYLRMNNHKAVNSQHLIDAFQATMDTKNFTNFAFETVFRTWELQRGYPVIHVSLTPSADFSITQQRFYTQKSEITDTTSSWYIPLTFATESNPNFEDTIPVNFFVNGQTTSLISAPAGFNDSQWFVFNKQQLGYYRVNYDFANWHALILVLNSDDHDKIHVLNRAQLVDDSLTFAAGGYLDYETTFGILTYLNHESEYTAWYPADRFISQLYTTFGPLNDDLNEFVQKISRRFYDKHRLDDYIFRPEGVYDRFSRELAFKLACNSGNEQCLLDTAIINHLFVDPEYERKVPKGFEDIIYCSGFRGVGKQDDWVAMWSKMNSSSDSTFRSQAINALGCSDDATVLKDYLESILGASSSVSYTQAERRSVFTSVLNSHSGLEAIISFLNNYELDIIRQLAYTLEEILTIIARTVKSRIHQAVFMNYLQSLTHLDTDVGRRISAVLDDNLSLQQQSPNVEIIEIIRKISQYLETTTTLTTTISTAPTTPTTNSRTSSTQQSPESSTLGASSVGTKFIVVIMGLIVACSFQHSL